MLTLKPETPSTLVNDRMSKSDKAIGRSQSFSPLPSKAMQHTSYNLTKIAAVLSVATIAGSVLIGPESILAAAILATVGFFIAGLLLIKAHRRNISIKSKHTHNSS